MNPAELTLTTISPSLTKAVPNHVSQKSVAPLASRTVVERINLEPIYTQMKGALGDAGWADYKAAIKAFALGSLNQAELSWVLQPLLSSAPSVITSTDSSKSPVSTIHLHNTLITALYANTLRDPPPAEIAPWVVATDKPTSSSKNAGAASGVNDKAEERVKREVMSMHPRDRKRIKALKEQARPVNDHFREIQDYANELAVRPPAQSQTQTEPQSATGTGPTALARTNFDIEIRRRYAGSLAAESLEFPALADIQSRIEPICYEEGLGGVQQGALQGCAELLEQAAEVFVKEMLGSLLGHARSDVPGITGVQTHTFRRRFRQEENDAERGIVQRTAVGLLPVELEIHASRDPLDMQDLALSLKLDDAFLKTDRFLDEEITLNKYPDLTPAEHGSHMNGSLLGPGRPRSVVTNGIGKENHAVAKPDPDAMAVDELDPAASFAGVSAADQDHLMAILDECLLAGG